MQLAVMRIRNSGTLIGSNAQSKYQSVGPEHDLRAEPSENKSHWPLRSLPPGLPEEVSGRNAQGYTLSSRTLASTVEPRGCKVPEGTGSRSVYATTTELSYAPPAPKLLFENLPETRRN